MIRALWIFTLAALVAVAVVWLADAPGYVLAEWRGYRIETSANVGLALLIIFAFALFLLLRVANWIARGPKVWRQFFARKKSERGMGALAHGLAAAASGDAAEAERASRKASKLVERSTLTTILALEAAQLAGNESDIQLHAEALTKDPETALLGWRALFDLAQLRGEAAKAENFAETAFENTASAGWAAEALIAAALKDHAFDRALATLDRAERGKADTPDRLGQARAAVLTAQGARALAAGDIGTARSVLRKAMAGRPGFTPAAVLRAQVLFNAGKAKRAEEIALEHWPHGPHPTLGALFLKARAGDEGELTNEISRLMNLNAAHAESQLLAASVYAQAGQYVPAREALRALLLKGRTARACALMAELALAERNDRAGADDWLKKGLVAPRDNVWECESCGHSQLEWTATCNHCDRVGTLIWFTHRDHDETEVPPDGDEATALVSPEDILRSQVDDTADLAAPAEYVSQEREDPTDEVPLAVPPPASEAETQVRQPDDPGPATASKRKEPKTWSSE